MDKYKTDGNVIYERVTSWPDGFGKGPILEEWALVCICIDNETAEQIAGALNAHDWAS